MALLTNRLVEVGAKPFTSREFWMTFPSEQSLIGLLDMSRDQIATHLVASDDMATRIRVLLDASRALIFESERLEESGIKLLTAVDDSYPLRLRDALREQCPVSLLVAGPVDWFSEPSVGIVGSRGISDEASEAAADVARAATRGGFGVVSGLARGIDQVSMSAGLDAGGRVCGIPTEGIRTIARRADIRAAIHDGVLALASPYGPDAPFSVGNAMGRNKMIYGSADMTVVITSDEGKGGTWGGATEALDKHYGRVFVWCGPGIGPGNAALIKRGAVVLERLDDDRWLTVTDPADTAGLSRVSESPRLF
jgi:predicted Rossmann fold nucleotide-binding protein DprA/Smf involved in DNA uptake